jgi:uncharacterized membrane protein YqhA
MKSNKLIASVIVLLCIGFLCGFMFAETKRPNVDGFFMSHNTVCYNFLAHDAELTKAHEEVHGLIFTDSATCENGGCYNHFCGAKQ